MAASIGHGGAWVSHFEGRDRRAASVPDIDSKLGRKLSDTPVHLSRGVVLYIPQHPPALHLPLYDVSDEYARAVRGEPVGSSRYKINLASMRKPAGDGTGVGEVRYLVDFEAELVDGKAVVERRHLGVEGVRLKLEAPAEPEDTFTVAKEGTASRWTINRTFPIPDTVAAGLVSRNPYFSISAPETETLISVSGSDARSLTLQWQVHPVEHGNLRYTLVDISLAPSLSAVEDNSEAVYAIYHHIGLGYSLSLNHSEGVLLLREGLGMEQEAVVVTSLLGLLWRLRELRRHYKKTRTFMEKERKDKPENKDRKGWKFRLGLGRS